MPAATPRPRRPGSTTLLPGLVLLAPGLGAPAKRVARVDGPGAPRVDEPAFKLPADAGDLRVVIQGAR